MKKQLFTLFNLFLLSVSTLNAQTSVWTQKSKIVAQDRDYSDQFGGGNTNNQGAVSISGIIAIVGAVTDNHSDLNNPGAAYIYEKSALRHLVVF